jgi:radical SAM superfamily enzyme YgiQ (UPF0313 family)
MGWDEVSKSRWARTRGELAREQGATIKDWGGRLPVALIYPNSYYIGMSNLGIHAVYKLLNSYGNVVCERVFWGGESVLSLESRRPLSDFAVLAFSISYELDYFNVVSILRASGIPIYAQERDERHPLIIAGGACITANPAPLLPFLDAAGIGEAEPMVPAMISVLTGEAGRDDKLRALAELSGVYVPQYYEDKVITRQWAHKLDDFAVHSVVITEDTELGDLYLVEIERGCNWSCRFCLVSHAFCPMRYRSVDVLLAQAEQGLKYRRRLGLVGPVVSDHPQIEELLPRLRKMGVGLSVSSLRVSPLSGTVLRELVKGGARTITLAPEAGSQRLRQFIGKGITEDDILEAVSKTAEQGVRQLKLYFMLGLPSETDDDIAEMVKLVLKCKSILDKTGCRLSLNIAPFVPKAGTPFQWLPMADLATLNRRLAYLKKRLSPKGVKIKSESPAWSQIQGALARGDEKLADVIAGVEEVSLAGWRKATTKRQLDIDFYVLEKWDVSQRLPWAMIDLGVPPEHLARELSAALGAIEG